MCEVRYVKAGVMFPVISEILGTGKTARVTITGSSMSPFLRQGTDSVELAETDFQSIRRGDIVLIRRYNGQYILHRVLSKKKDCFFMVGDAQQFVEGPLRPNQLIAVAKAVYRKDWRISCDSFWYSAFSELWLLLRPMRYPIIRAMHILRRVFDLATKIITVIWSRKT